MNDQAYHNPLWDQWKDVENWRDPIIAEIRGIRDEIDEMVDHDIRKYAALLKQMEEEHARGENVRFIDQSLK